ncbi:MAG TPA: glycosyltransferase [Anaerolineales bacterium]|nr:glycosyltransferase [Anaerolineales bacterium]
MKSEPRIAFITDALPSIGGGEKVLFAALEAFPHADIFTLVYNKKVFGDTPLADREIKTSSLNNLPFAHNHHRFFLPLMPAAIEQFDLRAYDLIVSFNYAVANGVQNTHDARHISYTHTPLRYAWTDINLHGTHTRRNPILETYMRKFRAWDKKAASRVHAIATNSQAVSRRIRLAYEREASVIYPPVEVERFRPSPHREGYFITVSRLVAHKRIDVLVRAFSLLNLPLLIIGEGPELPRLKSLAKPNIQFLGFQPDETVAALLGKARAFVSAAEEDFGIAIVEAQAAGCPVITYGQGGALETVVDGVTGLYFPDQSTTSLIDALQRFERNFDSFRITPIVHNSQKFGKSRFIREFTNFVQSSAGITIQQQAISNL